MNKELQRIDLSLPINSIDAYINAVNQIPMLSLEEEQELAKRYYEEEDLEAARRLILPHLRYVARVAKGYSGYSLQQADLIQEGNIGLMKAVKRFNPHMGVRLVSFAVHWIKAEMHEFILKNWRIVKVATTKSQRKLFFNLRKAKKRLGWFTQEEINTVAKDLGVSPEVVLEMEMRLNAYDAPFDGYADDDGDSGSHFVAPAHYLEDQHADPARMIEKSDWMKEGQASLYMAIEQLDERSSDILTQRWLAEKKTTLQVLADKYKISAERVRQLENSALAKLKEFMHDAA